MVREHKEILVIKAAAAIPDGESMAVLIECCCFGTPNTVDDETMPRAVADMISWTGGDRLHKEEVGRQLLAALKLIAPGNIRHEEGYDPTDLNGVDGPDLGDLWKARADRVENDRCCQQL